MAQLRREVHRGGPGRVRGTHRAYPPSDRPQESDHAGHGSLHRPARSRHVRGDRRGGRERAGCLVGFASQCSLRPVRFAVWLSEANTPSGSIGRPSSGTSPCERGTAAPCFSGKPRRGSSVGSWRGSAEAITSGSSSTRSSGVREGSGGSLLRLSDTYGVEPGHPVDRSARLRPVGRPPGVRSAGGSPCPSAGRPRARGRVTCLTAGGTSSPTRRCVRSSSTPLCSTAW